MQPITPSVGTLPARAPTQYLHWTEEGQACSAVWRSERGAAPPTKVVLADDTWTADAAYQMACGGTALLWRGDFHNARQLLQALQRRIDTPPKRKNRGVKGPSAAPTEGPMDPQVFHLHRQAQAQRARILAMVLVPLDGNYDITLRRAPDSRLACTEAWGAMVEPAQASVASLRDVLAMRSASEWRKNGVEIAALGPAPGNRIHPHYGVFSPVRGEYIDLVAAQPLPAQDAAGVQERVPYRAFDIGTGSGVLSAVLVRRRVAHVVATDQDGRAMACAGDNFARLGVAASIELQQTDMFPEGRANLVMCNPPWLPARPSAPVEYAVYDENSRMLLAFLAGLPGHLLPGGEGWLILSDLAERLGLRSPTMLTDAIAAAGLVVLGRSDAKPIHAKSQAPVDALHPARSREVTSLWRLGVAPVVH